MQFRQIAAGAAGLQLRKTFDVEPTDVRIPAERRDHYPPAGSEDPTDLRQNEFGTLQIAEQERGNHTIDALIRDGNPLLVANHVQIGFQRMESDSPSAGNRFETPPGAVEGIPYVVERDDLDAEASIPS